MKDPHALAAIDGKLKLLRQLLQDPNQTLTPAQTAVHVDQIIKDLETVFQNEVVLPNQIASKS